MIHRLKVLRLAFFVLFPALFAISVALLLQYNVSDIPIVYIRADLSIVCLSLGVLVSIWISSCIGVRGWNTRHFKHIVAQVQKEAASSRHRFLSRLDHELKNPLTAIRVGIANLAQSTETMPLLQETISSIELQTTRLSRLTSDLRKLADLETHPIVVSPINLAELLKEAVNFAQDQNANRVEDITLTLPQAPWPLPEVAGDWDLLLLASYNLLENALKFTQPGDKIELRAYENGPMVVIEVADTGTGIPEDEQPHIWEELYRGQGARGTTGSGLGLVLVRTIAVKHGGDVTVRSRPGQGTVFILRLPPNARP